MVIEEPEDEKLREIWNSCAVRSRSVEVLYRSQDSNEELLTKVHFNLATKVSFSDFFSLVNILLVNEKRRCRDG